MNQKGLTHEHVEKLLKEYGLNVLQDKKKKGIFSILFAQLNNFLTILLVIAALLSFFIGEIIDGSLILSIVFLNALFGIYQEKKAENAIDALKQMSITKVRVIRDGHEQELDSRYLVPGDIYFIEEGSKIAADGILEEALNLEVNEAALTGESLPVNKKNTDEIFMGTVVSKGRGYVKVTQTGMRTKFGNIAAHLNDITESKTPLQLKLEGLTKLIGIAGIVASLFVFVLSLSQNAGYFPSFLLAISLAVAVVPEGLPAVMTITLALGVKEMANKKAIMRKLSAVEALGSVTLIATDKTGTLTTNKMKVKEVFVDNKIHLIETPFSYRSSTLEKLVLDGVLCSTASLVATYDKSSSDVLGDPTEGALLFLAQDIQKDIDQIRGEWKLKEENPFDSVTKRMSVVVESKTDPEKMFIFTKGAPESVLSQCDQIEHNGNIEKLDETYISQIGKIMNTWASKGLRVLALSYRHRKSSKDIFLGMVAIYDAPRPEVKAAVEKAHHAGIKVVMITGDNEKTAEAIGAHAGIMKEGDEVVTGTQLDTYSDEDLLKILPKVRIFARTTPFHKSRIVSLYQQLGEIVAVTGDGVNDAIAMKQADVGVAMGVVGTDVARETADMVLTDDNFATIVIAIEEGRHIIKNLKNAIQYLLACNISEAIALIIGLWAGIPHLFYAIQLLYINLITDGIPALALSFSPRLDNVMSGPPAKKLNLLDRKEILYISIVGIVASIFVIGSYFTFYTSHNTGQTAAFSVLVLIQSFIFIDLWLSHKSLFHHARTLLAPIFLISFSIPFVLQLGVLRIQTIADLFKVEVVPYATFFEFICISATVLIAIRIVKYFVRIH